MPYRSRKSSKFSRRSSGIRRTSRSSGKTKRVVVRRRSTIKRRSPAMRTVKQRFPNFYGDVAITKLKDHFITASVYNSTDVAFSHASGNMQVLLMNANSNNGPLLSALGSTVATFQPLNFTALNQRYSQCRPMGAKVVIKISLPDSATVSNTPLVFACFPYQTFGTQYGNYWNGTTTPDLNLNVDSIGQMKYGKVRRIYGQGNKAALTFTEYFDFSKIVGRSRSQYHSDPNFQYDTTSTSAPPCNILLGCVVSDMTGASVRTYNIELFITQYVRMEAARLNPT